MTKEQLKAMGLTDAQADRAAIDSSFVTKERDGQQIYTDKGRSTRSRCADRRRLKP